MNIKDISISKLFRDQFNLLNKSTGDALELIISKLDTKQFLEVKLIIMDAIEKVLNK